MTPFFTDGLRLSQGCRASTRRQYFLPVSLQQFLLLTWSTLEGWKTDSTLDYSYKWSFYWVITWKLFFISGVINLWWWGSQLDGRSFPSWGGMSKLSTVEGDYYFPHPPSGENPVCGMQLPLSWPAPVSIRTLASQNALDLSVIFYQSANVSWMRICFVWYIC